MTAGPQSVAFLGLGRMGRPMATNLVAAGHEVRGFDVLDAPRALAAAEGVLVVATPAEAVRSAGIVITMLPSGAHVADVYGGPNGVLATASPGAILVDCSTIDVFQARELHERGAAAGFVTLDAPVSGGVVGAEAGTLTFMVGGDAEALSSVTSILDIMGARVVHCGGPGSGQAAKVCNNLLLGISMVAVSEAFVLGERLGLSSQALFDVASTSSGSCWALTVNCPVPGPVPSSPANRDYEAGFAVDLMRKDLGLAIAAARRAGLQIELGQHVAEVYERRSREGDGHRDFSVVHRALLAAGNDLDPGRSA